MRDKRIYTRCIAISEKDLNYVKGLKIEGTKSFAGVLSVIINIYRKKQKNKSTDLK